MCDLVNVSKLRLSHTEFELDHVRSYWLLTTSERDKALSTTKLSCKASHFSDSQCPRKVYHAFATSRWPITNTTVTMITRQIWNFSCN